jgi:hypothetical protein
MRLQTVEFDPPDNQLEPGLRLIYNALDRRAAAAPVAAAQNMCAQTRGRPAQLVLAILPQGDESNLVCRGIFSANYLRQHFAKSPDFPKADEVRQTYEELKRLWEAEYVGLGKRREAYTRTQFLEPVLQKLGWHFIPEQDLPSRGHTRKRPDYCLFLDDQARRNAACQSDTADVFRESATVLEAKKVQHSLDEVSSTETLGWFPSQQVQDYLHQAKDATGRRFFNWAILTNGNEWRLYCEQAATDAFFAFHLAHGDQFCTLEEFRLFWALFRPQAFERDAQGLCLLDRLRDESLTRQAELETNLRRRIFDVLEDLANGFRDFPHNRITQADLPALYDNALILLYRLLFVLYAESRGLLPVRPTGFGANKTYRERFSLARLVRLLRDKTAYASDAFTDLYEDLLKLFHLINGDRPEQNRECKVPRYNGGLFDPAQYPLLEQWRVSDPALAHVLRQLLFAQPPSRPGARQPQLSTDEAIDYSTLEVRQLGDIYEGLLGAHLEVENGRLVLKNLAGKNHNEGIFYTPDWVVRYLVRETLQPLIDEIEAGAQVQQALRARSLEQKRDNSFALAVLQLNLVDPAMGSGHFLVRATEWLAEQIVYHPTTRLMTEQIVATGQKRRSREDILRDGRIPVPPGFSQEQAEIAYWRRRVVEACIYGVDLNPLAVELAKLSLWLTCIAADEPLNFLDHHLRVGNSLLWANPDELQHLPTATDEDRRQTPFNLGPKLAEALRAVIAENHCIETTASTDMEQVKAKEGRWKAVRRQLDPFLDVANLWVASLAGLHINELDYRSLALLAIAPDQLTPEDRRKAQRLRATLASELAAKQAALRPFHWQLEFPDVFFHSDGSPRPEAARGFDAVLGNPPYVSTHTSAEQAWRDPLAKRAGYLEDLYLHFTNLGFQLLRPGGGFGFIVSDTFFTLASKLRMRQLLQNHTLTHLGQCDPFEATVDAAIFVARKGPPPEKHRLLFLQARPRRDASGQLTEPERDLPTLKPSHQLAFADKTRLASPGAEVEHGEHGCLRLHRVPLALYRAAHKQVFFEPRPQTLRLFERFNEPVKRLVAQWWPKIETSQKYADNFPEIQRYLATLKPGDITLVGLVAEGGQGMRTANNARFLGYLDGTPQAEQIKAKRKAWTQRWLEDPRIKPVFLELLRQNGGDPAHPTRNGPAWEACVEPLKQRFRLEQLGFTKSDLYRIVPPALVAGPADFQFAWQQRKAELLKLWRTSAELKGFWESGLPLGFSRQKLEKLRKQADITDAEFCELCQELLRWFAANNARRKARQQPIPRQALGLRSSENYTDPADAPRIATIYNGLPGRAQFVPFRKGDPEGNRWADNEQLFIDWSSGAVKWLSEASEARWQGHRFFFNPGVTWTAVANHVAMKARFQGPCVFDADSMRLTPREQVIKPLAFLGLLNSDLLSYLKMKFVKHTQKWEIGDLRQLPLVMPTAAQERRLTELAQRAIEAKRLTFTGEAPSNELAAWVRRLSDELAARAPAYLRPPAQQCLLATAADCLAIIELAVNWEAEKLYGVEGQGPFDEF